jgi:hypothetical protein
LQLIHSPRAPTAVALSYQDLWEALQANNFVVEDTIEHLMAQMASQGL